jgi:GGDEF domain-containing protein
MAVATKEQVEGLVNIGGRRLKGNEFVAAVEGQLVKNITDAMNKLGISIVDNLAKYAPVDQGKLAGSFRVLKVSETKTGYRLEISVGAEYSDYQDKGVRGIQNRRKTYKNADGRFYQFKTYGMPVEALQGLEGWMKRKNMEIEATNLIEGRQMLPQISTSAKRLAYYIKKYGIEGKMFVKKSIDEATPEFNIDIQNIGFNSLTLKISK